MSEIFPCTGCGMCCKQAGRAVETAKKLLKDGVDNEYVREVAAFPFAYDANGRCDMLDEDNKCMVYDDRPGICSIEKTWEKYHSAIIPKRAYFESTIQICNQLMKDGGVSENFFITDGKKDEEGADKYLGASLAKVTRR